MSRFVLPLSAPASRKADRVGPKAANLARLAQADQTAQRKLSLEIRLALYQSNFAPDLRAEIRGAAQVAVDGVSGIVRWLA